MAKNKENSNKEIKEVAALQYSPDENAAPKIVALGKGEIADRIIDAAKKNKIPLVKDENLAHTLAQLNIGDEIPPELYEVVAEILVFVNNLDRSIEDKNGSNR